MKVTSWIKDEASIIVHLRRVKLLLLLYWGSSAVKVPGSRSNITEKKSRKFQRTVMIMGEGVTALRSEMQKSCS